MDNEKISKDYTVKSVYWAGGTNRISTAVVELIKKEELLVGKANGENEVRAVINSVDSITGLKPEIGEIRINSADRSLENPESVIDTRITAWHRGLRYFDQAIKMSVAEAIAEAYVGISNDVVRQIKYDERLRAAPDQKVVIYLQPKRNGGYKRHAEVQTQAPHYTSVGTFGGGVFGEIVLDWYKKIAEEEGIIVNDVLQRNFFIRAYQYRTRDGLAGTSITVSALIPKKFRRTKRKVIPIGENHHVRNEFAAELTDIVRLALVESVR